MHDGLQKKLLIIALHDALTTKKCTMVLCSVHGYSVYNNYAPYNPVSRRDSELASLSSGRTDSDTMSISSMST